jgi:hypothetical protein
VGVKEGEELGSGVRVGVGEGKRRSGMGAVAAMGTVARRSLPASLVCASTSRRLASSLWGCSLRAFVTASSDSRLGFELQGMSRTACSGHGVVAPLLYLLLHLCFLFFFFCDFLLSVSVVQALQSIEKSVAGEVQAGIIGSVWLFL